MASRGQLSARSCSSTRSLPAFALTENEQKVYDLIDKESKHIDDVIRQSGMAASTVSVTLLGLEMKRIIRQLPGKMFVRNN